jgi:hypothetical protein|tara:strand:- start:61 stop:462 length:402 start_codon:yes stop_codon:yes gene_type:complete
MKRIIILLPILFLHGCIAEIALGTLSGTVGQLLADKIEAEYPEAFKLRRDITHMDRNKLLTIGESAVYLGVSKGTFNKIRQSGNPPTARYIDTGTINLNAKYTANDLDSWRDSLPTTSQFNLPEAERSYDEIK